MVDSDNDVGYVYIDGVLATTKNNASSISYNQGTFNIPYSNNPGYGYGKMGPISIYNKALSQDEVTQNFNALRGRYGI